MPITTPGHPEAIGIWAVYYFDLHIMNFDEINSPVKGYGHKMVDCFLSDFPKGWQASVIFDWSNGFWDKMKDKYSNIYWMY